MTKFIPLRNHSHYSLQLGLKRPKHIVEKCQSEGYEFAGICDVSTISGCVTFIKSCKEKGIKPIIGSEILLKDGSSISLFCRNLDGWKDLLKLISALNDDDLDLNQVLSHINPKNFICVDGYVGSAAFSAIVSSTECIFNSADYDYAMTCLYEDWKTRFDGHVNSMIKLFEEGYFLESNESDSETFPAAKIMSECVISYSDIVIPSSNSYYCERKDSTDHRILICSKLKTTMKKLMASIMSSCDIRLLSFIRSSNYYIKGKDVEHNPSHLLNMSRIPGLIQEFKILSKPRLPKFDCPNGQDENEYLKQLCRNGWIRVISGKITKEEETIYKDRVLKELDVIKKAELAGYFLIVQDYVNHFRNQGYLIGPARGSGAGSLVCYLIGITLIDPIKNGLIFERFFNAGRLTIDTISFDELSYKNFLSGVSI